MQPWQDPEIEVIRRRHAEFARSELEGDAAERDRAGEFSRERWRACAELGVLGTCIGAEYGGAGAPVAHAVAAFEGLSYGCRDGGFVYALASQLFGIELTLQLMAGDEVKRGYLPRLVAGDLLAAHAFTEEDSGSDAFSMRSTAREDGDGFVLSGVKRYITNAPHADVALVFARTAEERTPFGLGAFWVELGWPGARRGAEFDKVGLRTVHMGELAFDEVRVPAAHAVGGARGGLRVLGASTGFERALLLAVALGPMARAVDECRARARTRRQFDKPIGAFQQVSARIADMIARQRIARQVVYDMASRLDAGKSIHHLVDDAAIAKLFVSEAYVAVELSALQVFGVRGYLLESFAQQDLRDALSSTIWAGTSETLRNLVARYAGLPVD